MQKKLTIKNPIISNQDLYKIKSLEHKDFKTRSISALYEINKGHNGLEEALENIVNEVEHSVDRGCNIIIISDRNINDLKAPIPVLLVCSYVHQSMIRRNKRSKFGIIIESAEPKGTTSLFHAIWFWCKCN